MIRSLRKRPRADVLVNQQRKATHSTGRLVYLLMLAAFGLTLANFLLGDFLFLRANGLVVKDRITIAVTFIARVEEVYVREGQTVAAGDVLLRLQSSEMLERLGELSARLAEIETKSADFKIRVETAVKLLPLAQTRENETAKVMGKFDALSNAALVTAARYDEALRARFEARRILVLLQADGITLRDELATLQAARAAAAAAFHDLQRHYANGVVRAPAAGIAGASAPSPGDVYRPGEKLLYVHTGETYALTYLPRRYLFSLNAGQRVAVERAASALRAKLRKSCRSRMSCPRNSRTSSSRATGASWPRSS